MASSLGTTDGLLGPYRLGRRIGRGGMGIVYEATGPDGRIVAVKQLAVAEEGGVGVNIQRFLDEARLGATLEHPNIVRTLEGGVDRGHAFLAMERLVGAPLSALFHVPCDGMTVDLALAVVRPLLHALGYLHGEKGVIHRDLKPSNIFLTETGDVKLIDFGIATAESLDATATATGAVRGSFPFVSPEYLRGEPIDARADLYAVGLVLHELLTGSRVFNQPSQAAVVSAILFSPIPPVRSARPDVPPALDAVVMRAVSREKETRYASAAELDQALVATAGVEPASRGQLVSWMLKRRDEVAQHTAARPATASAAMLAPVEPQSIGVDTPKPRRSLLVPVLVIALLASVSLSGVLLFQKQQPDPAPAPPPVVAQPPPQSVATPEPEPSPAPAPVPAPDQPDETAASPKPKAKRGVGFLTVDARPSWAKVSIDGKAVGPTPLFRHALSAGPHRIDAVMGDGRKKTRTVTVVKDQESRLLFEW